MCEHKWISKNDLGGCGICQGDYGPVDGLLVVTTTEKPTDGDVCLECLQVFGQPEGTFHPGLKKFNNVQEGFTQK